MVSLSVKPSFDNIDNEAFQLKQSMLGIKSHIGHNFSSFIISLVVVHDIPE